MKGKIALVSGANKSIGFEVVCALAKQEMTVYLGSRDAEDKEETDGTFLEEAPFARGDNEADDH